MNAPVTKDQLSFSLGNLSYIGPAYEDLRSRVVKPRTRREDGIIHRLVSAVVGWRRRQAVLREMQLMTDHELSDIGLSRSDLSRVFDPVFAEDHRRGRDYIAY